MIATAIGGLLFILGAIAFTASRGIRIDRMPITISGNTTESRSITMADSIEVTLPDAPHIHVYLSPEAGIQIVVADTDTPRVEYPSELSNYITVSERNGKLTLLIGRTEDPEKDTKWGYYRYVECPHPIRIVMPAAPAKVRSALSNVPVILKDASADSICLQIRGTTHLDGCRLTRATINPADLGQYPEFTLSNTSISAISVGERTRQLTLKADSLSTVEAIDWHSTLKADANCDLDAGRLRIGRISFSSVTDSTRFTLNTTGAFTLDTNRK